MAEGAGSCLEKKFTKETVNSLSPMEWKRWSSPGASPGDWHCYKQESQNKGLGTEGNTRTSQTMSSSLFWQNSASLRSSRDRILNRHKREGSFGNAQRWGFSAYCGLPCTQRRSPPWGRSTSLWDVNHHRALESSVGLLEHTDAWAPTPRAQVYLI